MGPDTGRGRTEEAYVGMAVWVPKAIPQSTQTPSGTIPQFNNLSLVESLPKIAIHSMMAHLGMW